MTFLSLFRSCFCSGVEGVKTNAMEDEGVKGVIFVKEFRSCCLNSCKQHALNQRSPAEGKGKGQKLLAQGNALGYHVRKLGAL